MVLLMAVMFGMPKPHWVKVKDSYYVHEMYVGVYGEEIGEYYEPAKGDKYVAQCWQEVKQVEFAAQQDAANYAEKCPQ